MNLMSNGFLDYIPYNGEEEESDNYDECRVLFYNDIKNVFENEDGFVVIDIFNIIHPNTLWLFKHFGETTFVDDINGRPVELVWLGSEGD